MFFVCEDFFLRPLRAFSFLAADLFKSLLLATFFLKQALFDAFAKFAPRMEAIHLSGAFLLAFDFDAARDVLEIDAGGGFVDFLSAAAGAEDEFFDKIGLMDAETLHLFLEALLCGFRCSHERIVSNSP